MIFDFFLWSYLKYELYSKKLHTTIEVKEHVIECSISIELGTFLKKVSRMYHVALIFENERGQINCIMTLL
jgi:hypothetical protein